MPFATSIAVLKPILAVGTVALVGMGGFNLATTGCPLGSCSGDNANTVLTSSTDSKVKGTGCCPSEAEAESVTLVGLDGADEAKTGCTEAMKAACEAMGECPESMMVHCDASESECPMGEQATDVTLVNDADATECEKACEGKTECDESAAQTADAETADDTSAG